LVRVNVRVAVGNRVALRFADGWRSGEIAAASRILDAPAPFAHVRARLVTIAACAALVPLGLVLPPVATVAILLILLIVLVGAEGTFVRSESA
jgi:hypothetical protein